MIVGNRRRWEMAVFGAVAGVAIWALSFHSGIQARGLWLLTILVTIGSISLLTLWPRLSAPRAAATAAGIGVMISAMAAIGMAGYVDVYHFFSASQMWLSLICLPMIALPFLVAAQREPGGWRSYQQLFRHSWDIVGSWVMAGVFTGLAWAVLGASAALLSYVEVTLPARVLSSVPVMFGVTGLLLGLGLALIAEREGAFEPVLLLRLMPILLPVFLLVIAVFILALPFGVRPALPLAALCIGAVMLSATLISALVNESDAEVSASAGLRVVGRLLALTMPILALVTIWALWQRVAPYGLTPLRVCAWLLCLVSAGYAFGYLYAAAHKTAWMARVRQVNLVMALVIAVLAALLLMRVIWPEALSARSQAARIEQGTATDVSDVLRRMRYDWGIPGQRAYERLTGSDGVLADGVPEVQDNEALSAADKLALLAQQLPSLPADHPAREGFALGYTGWDIDGLNESCGVRTPAGHPGCLVVFVSLDPSQAEPQAIVFGMASPERIRVFGKDEDGRWAGRTTFSSGVSYGEIASYIDELYAEARAPVPVPWQVLPLGQGYLGVLPVQ